MFTNAGMLAVNIDGVEKTFPIVIYNRAIHSSELPDLDLPYNEGLREQILGMGVDVISAHRSGYVGGIIAGLNYGEPLTLAVDGVPYYPLGKYVLPRNMTYEQIYEQVGRRYVDKERDITSPPVILFRTCTEIGEPGTVILDSDGNPTDNTQFIVPAIPEYLYYKNWSDNDLLLDSLRTP